MYLVHSEYKLAQPLLLLLLVAGFVTVKCFWHIRSSTSWPQSLPSFQHFWLRIVLMATAVLPIWRSPMISSRWPWPIGAMTSIGLRPVIMGWLTEWRGRILGAFREAQCSIASMGPLPSMGLPKASTTWPRSPGPTGISTIWPVRFTVSPSLMRRSLPKMETPTLSTSKLRHMPRTPEENSTIFTAVNETKQREHVGGSQFTLNIFETPDTPNTVTNTWDHHKHIVKHAALLVYALKTRPVSSTLPLTEELAMWDSNLCWADGGWRSLGREICSSANWGSGGGC